MNEVTCSICSQSVSKRQTLSVGDGKRACRSHQEAQAASKQLVAGQTKKSQQDHKPQRDQSIEIELQCFICREAGIRQDEFFVRLLIDMEKHKLLTGQEANLLDPTVLLKVSPSLKGKKVLWYVLWEGKNRRVKLPFQAYQVAEMVGSILACTKCCDERGLERASDHYWAKADTEVAVLRAELARPLFQACALMELEKGG